MGTHKPSGTQERERDEEQETAQLAVAPSHTARVVHGVAMEGSAEP